MQVCDIIKAKAKTLNTSYDVEGFKRHYQRESARFEVIEHEYWRNMGDGSTSSIYGAYPWVSETDKRNWKIESGGWNIRDNKTGTIGQAFGLTSINRNILESVQGLADKLNKRESE